MRYSAERLRVLHKAVEERCRAVASSVEAWPCRKGCDRCCRSLARPPELTRAEWDLVEQGLAQLPADARSEVAQHIASLRVRSSGSFCCPFLDRSAGACRIYEFRPVACRTYGCYAERGGGLYCNEIQSMVDRGETAGVVWGNHAAVEADLARLGMATSFREWAASFSFD